MNKDFDNDPIVKALREKHKKQGPDPKPGESLDKWAERYMEYVRKEHGLKDD
jgi:hypothetical protein